MKITRLRIAALALITAIATFLGSASQASAATYVSVRVGPPPPPPGVYRPWPAPYRTAVWIPGHNEWINGRWVWIGGYYAYPPRPGAIYVPSRYHHHRYYPGYWR